MAFTDDQITAYIESGGITCPACGSADITGGSVEIDAGGASQSCSCSTCDCEWTDRYTLTHVEQD